MTMPKPSPVSNPQDRTVSKNVFTGFVLEGLALVLIWTMIYLLPPARESCTSGDGGCFGWRLSIVLLSLILVFISLFAFLRFRQVPNKSLPPEKLAGIIISLTGLISGLIIAVAVLMGYFI